MKHPDKEELYLSTSDGKSRAEGMRKKPDPFDKIAPSLLSGQHIREYVEKTGLVSPFYIGGGRKSRLKFASYEGRIGSCAYAYEPEKQDLVPIFKDGDTELVVPANSIVYVECDLEFRLPTYIALRFNLQIRHVHRGLLLGTGPLVDPGYWGRLCIPLHNLTDSEYRIPRDEGLVWFEFTKTTIDSDEGRPPLDKEFWDIRDFIKKAAQPYDRNATPIAIRSSIPEVGRVAANEAKAAAASARSSEQVAARMQAYGILAALVAAIAVLTLWAAFYFGLRADINAVNQRVDQLRDLASDDFGIPVESSEPLSTESSEPTAPDLSSSTISSELEESSSTAK